MIENDEVTISNLSPPIIGSHRDIYNKLISMLPNWFGTDHINLDTILESFITTGTFHYEQLIYVALQMRLQTATDINIDAIAADYLGNFPRRAGENDATYKKRILATLLQEKATRFGMSNALYLLTGYRPILFEPWYPPDCGGYNVASSMGYSIMGLYGSDSYAYQGFVDVFVSQFQGLANYSGYNDFLFGYSTAGGKSRGWYGGESLITEIISDQDIYDTINLTKVEGTIVWVRIIRQ